MPSMTATTVMTMDGVFYMDYHSTRVASYAQKNGRVSLDTGGWKTATTKKRMNQFSRLFGLGFEVYQKDFEWFVSFPDDRETIPFDGDKVVFYHYHYHCH